MITGTMITIWIAIGAFFVFGVITGMAFQKTLNERRRKREHRRAFENRFPEKFHSPRNCSRGEGLG